MEEVMNVALTIDKLVPRAEYFGSPSDNTKESYDALRWFDSRPKPTWEQIESEWVILSVELKKQDCKDEAKRRIALTDWSVLPDRSVMLDNSSDFVTYRTALLNLILSPVDNPTWPTEPTPRWKS